MQHRRGRTPDPGLHAGREPSAHHAPKLPACAQEHPGSPEEADGCAALPPGSRNRERRPRFGPVPRRRAHQRAHDEHGDRAVDQAWALPPPGSGQGTLQRAQGHQHRPRHRRPRQGAQGQAGRTVARQGCLGRRPVRHPLHGKRPQLLPGEHRAGGNPGAHRHRRARPGRMLPRGRPVLRRGNLHPAHGTDRRRGDRRGMRRIERARPAPQRRQQRCLG